MKQTLKLTLNSNTIPKLLYVSNELYGEVKAYIRKAIPKLLYVSNELYAEVKTYISQHSIN